MSSNAHPLRASKKSNSPTPTSPLRIAKRDELSPSPLGTQPSDPKPPVLARRQSSSYAHLRSNNLVSKSPFKSQITPGMPSTIRPKSSGVTPRKVSGEKRPRPISMQSEGPRGERTSTVKRRQANALQNLQALEQVSNSPFRRESIDIPPPLPPKNSTPISIPPPFSKSRVPVPPDPQPSQPSQQPPPPISSSTRSVLVSRRLHGPRGTSTRARRKTVTFDERCDVVEFDRESHEMDLDNEDAFYSTDDEEFGEGEYEEYEEMGMGGPEHGYQESHEGHYIDVREDSIVGLVDSMLQDNDTSDRPRTPPNQPLEVDGEDGVPYGRSHHAERAANAHSLTPRTSDLQTLDEPMRAITPPATGSPVVGPGSEGPLGRSTHAERVREVRELDRPVDLQSLPNSPSPHKAAAGRLGMLTNVLPSFAIDLTRDGSPVQNPHTPDLEYRDPFTPAVPIPALRVVPDPDPHDEPTSSDERHQSDRLPATPEGRDSTVSLRALEAELGISPSRSTFSADDRSESGSSAQEPDDSMMADEPDDVSTPSAPPPPNASESATGGSPRLNSVLARLSSPFGSNGGSRSTSPRAPSPLQPPSRASSPFRSRDSPVTTHGPSPLAHTISDSAVSSLSSVESGRPSSLASSATLSGSLNGPPAFGDNQDSVGSGRRSPHITREDVKMRLAKRSIDSPLREFAPEELGFVPDRKPVEEVRPLVMHMQRAASMEPMEIMSTGDTEDLSNAKIEVAERAIPSPAPPLATLRARAATVGRPPSAADAAMSGPMGMRSALERLMDDVASDAGGTVHEGMGRMRLEVVTEGIRPGTFSIPSLAQMRQEEQRKDTHEEQDLHVEKHDEEHEMHVEKHNEAHDEQHGRIDEQHEDHADEPSDESMSEDEDYGEVQSSTVAEPVGSPPPLPPKDARKSREEAILLKRREARRRDDGLRLGYGTPPRDHRPLNISIRRPSGHDRSKSMNDAQSPTDVMLDITPFSTQEDPLADSIARELRKLGGPSSKAKYHVREREEIVYASTDDGHVSHSRKAGDLSTGKAWRAVRRPSDMNEYAKQIKEYRSQTAKTHGKVFVKVTGIRGLDVPLPKETTMVSCTLNNGIHYVSTPEIRLAREASIEQEFELIEHSKLEFTLTLKVRRDPHILAQFKANTPPAVAPPPPPPAPSPSPVAVVKSGGMRSFFLGTPKRSSRMVLPPPAPTPSPRPAPQPQFRLENNLARYLKSDGTLARAFVAFKDVAHRCDTRQFQIALPLIGQRTELGGKVSPLQVGELVLDLFRLPPLPVPPTELPQSLDECHRGLRNVAWHKATYFEGILTQNGGDCTSWRRRHFRIVGANLIAFNDVTKKPIATIDLRKAVAIEDDQQLRTLLLSPQSGATGTSSRYIDEFDGPGVERSFRLIFPENQEISFFADTDDEKARWLEVLRALVGHIPPNPLWAELLWQRQQELARQPPAAAGSTPATPS